MRHEVYYVVDLMGRATQVESATVPEVFTYLPDALERLASAYEWNEVTR